MYQEDAVILSIKPGGEKAKTGTTPKKNGQMYSISGDFNILFSINDRTGNQKG